MHSAWQHHSLTTTPPWLSGRRSYGGRFDPDAWAKRLAALEAELADPAVWQDRERAQGLSASAAGLRRKLERWNTFEQSLSEAQELLTLADQQTDLGLLDQLAAKLTELTATFEKLSVASLLAGPYDQRNAWLSVHAGAGGDDAQDWAQLLLRMYLRFAEQQEWEIRVVDESRGGEVGLKSALVEVKGDSAFGWLQGEAGVHRLVRLSPFDADHARHTSFALVEVLPELENVDEVPIPDKELRVDTFQASGHGGQSVNTTYSAVRIVHLPTGITVQCQNERSQLQNRATAMKILQGKLLALRLADQEAEARKLKGEFKSIEWGSQIRSYVLHPYHMVKDHRTGYESSNPEAVLEGDLQALLESYLHWKAGKGR